MILLLGNFTFIASVVTSSLSLLLSLYGILVKRVAFQQLAQRIYIIHFYILLLTVVSLVLLMAEPNLSVKYVFEHVNIALPLFYKITSIWAGQAGSLLWWNFILVLCSVISLNSLKYQKPEYVPCMVVIFSFSSLFFCCLGNFSLDSNPFIFTDLDGMPFYQKDGRGLNPLLQHWAMIIHPPILYIGYISFIVPYAITMAALWSNDLSNSWTKIVRRWLLVSWFFLGVGILLGGKWAYEELGWGGYWAWDPVENASLMPWLSSTAFLHSIIIQEKRDMFKIWNIFLVACSFFMCIFGTFLTRSGIVNSVHAFASTDLGPFFLAFLALIVIFTVFLLMLRWKGLTSSTTINSYFSKEAAFLLNNIFFLLALATLIWGTLYPSFSEFFFNQRASVTAVWFNQWMSPLGLVILFLTGVGPLLSWRITKLSVIRKKLVVPIIGFVLFFVIFNFIYLQHHSYALISLTDVYSFLAFSLSGLVIFGVIQEFLEVAIIRSGYTKESFGVALVKSVLLNKRRYVGFSVHLGIALLFIGFSGKALTGERQMRLSIGEAQEISGYTIVIRDRIEEQYNPLKNQIPLYVTQKVFFDVYKNNNLIGTDTTEKRVYPLYNLREDSYSDTQTTSEPGIVRSNLTDVYLQYVGEENGRYIIQVWINPLVQFVWFGFVFATLFGFILLLPFGENGMIKIGKKTYNLRPIKIT